MINVLDSICGYNWSEAAQKYVNPGLQPVWNIVGIIVNVIMIGVPILLIIFGMIDLGKAVIASKEDEVKKATKLLGKRFLYAIGVFAMVWLVTFVLTTMSSVAKDTEYDYNENKGSWKQCWQCNIRKNNTDSDFQIGLSIFIGK